MRRPIGIVASLAVLMLALPALAQDGTLDVTSIDWRQDRLDQIFDVTVSNRSDSDVIVSGKLIVLNVYDTSPPASLPLETLAIDPGGSETASVRWIGAPLLGQVRALLVVNGGTGGAIVKDFSFWIFSWQVFAVAAMAVLVLVGLSFGVVRLLRRRGKAPGPSGPGSKGDKELEKGKKGKKGKRRKPRRKWPSGMTGYVTEFGDTVVTVSNRFGVTWEDVVRTNRLKPPYTLKPGMEILIPYHAIRKPEDGGGVDEEDEE